MECTRCSPDRRFLRNLFVATAAAVGSSTGAGRAAAFLDLNAVGDAVEYAGSPWFAPVGHIEVVGTDGSAFGSGTLIGSTWVLTAAHVVSNSRVGDTLEARFSLGTNSGDPERVIAATRWTVHPDWTKDSVTSGVDLAILELSEPIADIEPATLYDSALERDEIVTMAGFGHPGTPAGYLPEDGMKRAGQNLVDRHGGGAYWWIEQQYALTYFSNRGGPQSLEWQGTPGDSGGGWFVERDGEWMLAAVTSFAVAGGGAGSEDYFLLRSMTGAIETHSYASWIRSITAVPEPEEVATLSAVLLMGGAWLVRRGSFRPSERLG